MPGPGGLGETKCSSEEVENILSSVKKQIEEKIGKALCELSVHSYKTQVVAGLNYFIKAKVGPDEYLHLRLYRDLSGETSLHGVQTEKKEPDEILYF